MARREGCWLQGSTRDDAAALKTSAPLDVRLHACVSGWQPLRIDMAPEEVHAGCIPLDKDSRIAMFDLAECTRFQASVRVGRVQDLGHPFARRAPAGEAVARNTQQLIPAGVVEENQAAGADVGNDCVHFGGARRLAQVAGGAYKTPSLVLFTHESHKMAQRYNLPELSISEPSGGAD